MKFITALKFRSRRTLLFIAIATFCSASATLSFAIPEGTEAITFQTSDISDTYKPLENNKNETWTSGSGSKKVFGLEVEKDKISKKSLEGAYSLEIETRKEEDSSGSFGSCDIYVKHGSAPSTGDYDFRIYGGGKFKRVIIDVDGKVSFRGGQFNGSKNVGVRGGTWFVMLHNRSRNPNGSVRTTYSLKARADYVEISRSGGRDIVDKPTWLLIHGKQSLNTAGAGDATFGKSADALEGQGSSQALIVDWSSGAASSILDLSQGRYFVPLGKKMKQLLARKRLNGPSEFSVLGHSWGTLVGHEFAAQFKRKIDRFVALDPAREAFGGYDDGRVNFKDRAKSSWSFVAVQGIFGDEKKARTAEHAVAVEFSPVSNLDLFSRYLIVHGAVVQMFEEMIDECYGSSAQPDNISAKMKPSLSGYVPKWKKNRFNQSGEIKPWMKGKNRFEAFMKCDLFDKNGKFKKLDSAKFVNESGNEKILTR